MLNKRLGEFMKALLIMAMLAMFISSATSAEENTSAYWTTLGDELNAQYKFDDAIQAYDKALEINKSHIAALAGKGEALWNTGRYNESLKSFDEVLNLSPYYVRAWVGKGVAFHSLGNLKESRRSYDRALEIDPKYAMAWNDKAWLFYKQDMYQEAVDYSDRAIEILDRNLAATIDTKAVALEKLGKNDEALEWIDKALELTPTDSIIWIHKGDILKALGNQTGSEAAYAKAKELPEQILDNSSV
ncbi:MAG: tetratricopeptide repeat protein [Methanosaeta sp. PtaU1.Bin112]|nr:MAG: tetratricopeptide repeat protein [Methanosaeta sp. PtaU1.Bin112]